jgi:transcriptional regulator with XRE-family HTH domain
MNGAKIKRLRVAQRFTQIAVAEYVGVSVRTVVSWELGERIPGGDKIAKLAECLGVTADELLREE